MNPFAEKINNDTLIIVGMIIIAIICALFGIYENVVVSITSAFAGYMQGKNG